MSDKGAEEAPVKPPRPRRSKNAVVEVLGGLMSLTFVIAIAAVAALYVGRNAFVAPGPLQQDKVIYFPKGQSIDDIAARLEREGVVTNAWVFQAGVHLRQAKLKAGEYLFRKNASMSDVVAVLESGKSILHAITIPEGLTSEQIVARLKENDVLVGDVTRVPPEGSLLPETYKFTRGMTRQDLLQKMAQDRLRVVQDAWQRRAPNLPISTPEDLVILASMVEKETGKPEERARVAAVFYNRLKKQMRLQSDPTIIYGLVGGKGSLGRAILKSEIEKPTSYNTYVINGLPPTPIANPGRQAIEAAARPAQTNDLYFVADGTGGHAFAESIQEHQRNVARWREIEAQRRAAGGDAAELGDKATADAVAPDDALRSASDAADRRKTQARRRR
jgi:UPF0755 protein